MALRLGKRRVNRIWLADDKNKMRMLPHGVDERGGREWVELVIPSDRLLEISLEMLVAQNKRCRGT